jgi:chromosome segregation ATPase
MVEPIMYLGIGFLVAALLGVLFIPLVHDRAVRLTMRRLEAATPMSIAEIRADKDQLRAEFAMSTRRLEMSVEQMKAKTTSQLAELARKSEAISQLKKELGEKTATIFEMESRDKMLREQLRSTEEEFAHKNSSLRQAERALSDKEADLAKLISELGERTIIADSQRVELAALRTQIEAMKVSVGDYERAVRETEERLGRERSDAAFAAKELSEARGKVDNLGSRTTELERQLIVQSTEAGIMNRRVQELEMLLNEQGRQLAEREFENAQLRSDLAAAAQIEADLRSELASAGGRDNRAAERFRADIAQLEAQLAAALDERGKLQREIAVMKRDAESTWASERVENALLRERINDVAAEVARLTSVLEGPGSAIESMLAAAEVSAPDRAAANGAAAAPETGGEAKTTLADRIRALQTTASRVASTS